MKREYPCVEIDLCKITHNAKTILSMCSKKGIEVVGVTKVFCAELSVVQAILKAGITHLGDSRVKNLMNMKDICCKKTLLRISMESEAEEVVKYSDISLNSELETIKVLAKAAKNINKVHNIILMVDVGDLREGVLVKDVIGTVKEILKLDNIKLVGLGTNVTCYGGVLPDKNNLGKLVKLKKDIKNMFGIEIPIISGGNSSSLYMVMNDTIPKEINQLRIGEGILLGRETAFGKPIPKCYDDAFILKGEIVEVKEKPTVPTGEIGRDAFGEKPYFKDIGIRKRAIAAVGRQDIKVDGLTPLDENISIFGASSDHLILDITDSSKVLQVGDIVEFKMDYGCVLAAMTSQYVKKYYVKELKVAKGNTKSINLA
ncbi:alanine/ornithine racemase family PLP-dependent enzyme [Clostridium sp. P21]|uniref:Alanine/ornithine racemase family PLP-dependent enzyme n=1 Tax=Clostridium muellerianum TaxID=2716538 RepID=A0A7Y0HNC2_9CLOT|nr:ornithine racemase Orr [Clostridium muellerianum]NMM63869.1 alanine/ornithine racemase family PLP-dependent enzyme [Clostridium muellerianum]